MAEPTQRSPLHDIAASLRVLVSPTSDNFRLIAHISDLQWLRSILIYASGATLAVVAVAAIQSSPMSLGDALSVFVTLGLLALAWASAAQAATTYILRSRHNIFDPLLYLASIPLLVLLVASLIAPLFGPLPSVLALGVLIYSQLLVVLAIRAVCRTTFLTALIIAAISGISSVILAMMVTAIVGGMPGFFERGYLS